MGPDLHLGGNRLPSELVLTLNLKKKLIAMAKRGLEQADR